MALISRLKLWALVDFVNKVEARNIVDLLEDFAHKYFKENWKDSLRVLQFKLANIVVEMQRRVI